MRFLRAVNTVRILKKTVFRALAHAMLWRAGKVSTMRPHRVFAIIALFGLTACAEDAIRPPTPRVPALDAYETPPPVKVTSTEAPRPQGQVHRLVIATTGCWLGGLWAGALGESSADRCADVLRQSYGTVDRSRLERLRTLEDGTVREMRERFEVIALADPIDRPRTDLLLGLFRTIAAAQKESVLARQAAGGLRDGISKHPSDDERAEAGALSASQSLEALLGYDAGVLRSEAHAIGVLSAFDRVEIARDLPKQVKIYAVKGAFEALLGAGGPSADPSRATSRGWPALLVDAAAAAQHPVPAGVSQARERERLAWNGVLEGFADRLRADRGGIDDTTELRGVVDGVIRRLDSAAHMPD